NGSILIVITQTKVDSPSLKSFLQVYIIILHGCILKNEIVPVGTHVVQFVQIPVFLWVILQGRLPTFPLTYHVVDPVALIVGKLPRVQHLRTTFLRDGLHPP